MNDIQGVAGELIALRRFETALPSASIEHNAMDWGGFVNEVDLVVSDTSGRARIEAKCHLDEPGKQLFLINRRAHERSKARGAEGYLPILSRLGAAGAFVGRLIPVAEVDAWPQHTWRSRPERDVAVGLTLESLCPAAFDRPFLVMRERLRNAQSVATLDDDLAEAYRRGTSLFGQLKGSAPDLRNRSYSDLVAFLI